jgi:hypothetical protein
MRARWTLIAPDGKPFISLGVVHIVDIEKTAVFQSRDSANPQRACERLPRTCALGGSTRPVTHPLGMCELMPFMAEVYLAQVAYWMPRMRYVDVFSLSYLKAVYPLIRTMVLAVKANPNFVGTTGPTPRDGILTSRAIRSTTIGFR